MPIESKDGALMITGANSIRLYRLLALKGALKLEIIGLRHSRGSVSRMLKEEFSFKGNKREVLAQLEAYIAREYPPESAQ